MVSQSVRKFSTKKPYRKKKINLSENNKNWREEDLVNATPADVDNILQRSDIRFDSVQEIEAPEETENYEIGELDYYEEPQICKFSDFSNHRATWHTEAIEKFDSLLTEAARENSSGSFSAKFVLKIRTRYDALLKFLTSADYTYCSAEISCTRKDEIFGSKHVVDVENLIEIASSTVDLLENLCPELSFSKFFVTFDGKASEVL